VSLTEGEVLDLQRYIDVTRGELYFARGIVLVEGDAERFLVPAFAAALGLELDELGVTICSVAGTNFAPYAKLLGPDALAIPHAILTDRDPVQGEPPRARNRIQRLLEILEPDGGFDGLTPDAIFNRAVEYNIFVNNETLETDLFSAGLGGPMRDVLAAELRLGQATREALDSWVEDPSTLDGARLIRGIERVGKGRFAQLLAPSVTDETCPEYIRTALEAIRGAVA
jgi:putative ATP-dependent endonuclease of OLD family